METGADAIQPPILDGHPPIIPNKNDVKPPMPPVSSVEGSGLETGADAIQPPMLDGHPPIIPNNNDVTPPMPPVSSVEASGLKTGADTTFTDAATIKKRKKQPHEELTV